MGGGGGGGGGSRGSIRAFSGLQWLAQWTKKRLQVTQRSSLATHSIQGLWCCGGGISKKTHCADYVNVFTAQNKSENEDLWRRRMGRGGGEGVGVLRGGRLRGFSQAHGSGLVMAD